MNGDSYRLNQSRRRQPRLPTEPTTQPTLDPVCPQAPPARAAASACRGHAASRAGPARGLRGQARSRQAVPFYPAVDNATPPRRHPGGMAGLAHRGPAVLPGGSAQDAARSGIVRAADRRCERAGSVRSRATAKAHCWSGPAIRRPWRRRSFGWAEDPALRAPPRRQRPAARRAEFSEEHITAATMALWRRLLDPDTTGSDSST